MLPGVAEVDLSNVGDTAEVDAAIGKSLGQDVIDSLSVLEAVVPTLHEELRSKLSDLLPMLSLTLRSRFAIIRQSAARCFATICSVMTVESMLFVVEKVIPFLGDSLNLSNRQGATELIYRSCNLQRRGAIAYLCFVFRYRADARCEGSALHHLLGCAGPWQNERFG